MLTEREFDEIQRRVAVAWHRGDAAGAFAESERALRDGTPEMRATCLLYRGMIREGDGALAEARREWAEGLRHASAGTFLRHRLEHQIGEALEREGRTAEALGWYERALETCSGGDEFSGHQTLAAYLRLKGGEAAGGDGRLLAAVAEKSWRVLELAGAPDLEDLSKTSAELAGAFASRVGGIV